LFQKVTDATFYTEAEHENRVQRGNMSYASINRRCGSGAMEQNEIVYNDTDLTDVVHQRSLINLPFRVFI
jgi:hypothetical protein